VEAIRNDDAETWYARERGRRETEPREDATYIKN
jgi:hypothetical protein